MHCKQNKCIAWLYSQNSSKINEISTSRCTVKLTKELTKKLKKDYKTNL